MQNEQIEQEFFEAFGIKPNVRNFEQYNHGQVKRGLEIYKEAEKLEKQGIIKITHRMLNARPENDCIYWEEMHYPPITPEIVLGLMQILADKYGTIEIKPLHRKYYVASGTELYSNESNTISGAILYNCIKHKEDIQDQVKALFKC